MQVSFSNLAKIEKKGTINKMNINKFKRLLAERGFSYSRRGKGSHEIWVNENGESFSFVPINPKRSLYRNCMELPKKLLSLLNRVFIFGNNLSLI